MPNPETTRCPEWPRCGCGGQPCKREGAHQTAAAKSGTTEREERLEEAMERIAQWADAYPTSVFPVPDDDYMQRAHEVLKAHGMTVDRISADAMRHVLHGIGRIARAALKDSQP